MCDQGRRFARVADLTTRGATRPRGPNSKTRGVRKLRRPICATMRTVTVQAEDFTGIVPISVVLTPESGDPVVYDTSIDMGMGNPAQVVVNVDFPVNTKTHVKVWTR